MIRRLSSLWRRYRSEQRGAAAAEFALVVTLLTVPVLNVVDLAMYAWDRMQVDNAAQMGVQAAWATCSTTANLPATVGSNCSAMSGAVTTAVQSSSLGTNVTWAYASTPTGGEAYYCVVSGALAYAGPVSSAKPANCAAGGIGGSASDTPGDYISIVTSYTYTPIFSAVSIASGLTSPITRQAWMRLG